MKRYKKIGDLVKWSDLVKSWHAAHLDEPDLWHKRQRGVIVDENMKYYFVFWEDGELIAELPENLEVVNEHR